jgi:hypothetical protein
MKSVVGLNQVQLFTVVTGSGIWDGIYIDPYHIAQYE